MTYIKPLQAITIHGRATHTEPQVLINLNFNRQPPQQFPSFLITLMGSRGESVRGGLKFKLVNMVKVLKQREQSGGICKKSARAQTENHLVNVHA